MTLSKLLFIEVMVHYSSILHWGTTVLGRKETGQTSCRAIDRCYISRGVKYQIPHEGSGEVFPG